ncbi:MAG TPA: glucodextranase DOMON-like domain-containing protein [Thermoanaerobaculia bacterium]|nr:glucodextranase DOMON-like domain-containing protein [Thermoanaerobaculia bacterium]
MRISRPQLLTSALVLLFLSLPALAGPVLFTLTDPRGDDHGDGKLVYPLNDELDPGDLDLLSVRAESERDGTTFELTFAKPVKTPGREPVDDLGTPLDTVARFGFYTLNVDIYIDMDRVPGQGGLEMLPGRNAEVDPASAWERAIILTPRPNEARGELKRMLTRSLNQEAKKEDTTLSEEQIASLRAQIPGDVEERIFFPTQVRVRGQKITFTVPNSFLGGPAKDTWSYVIAVSGNDLLQTTDLRRLAGKAGPESLMILPVSPGRWQDRFGGGRENAEIQPPLIDIVVPKGKTQEEILANFDQRGKRPVLLPGVVPAEQK